MSNEKTCVGRVLVVNCNAYDITNAPKASGSYLCFLKGSHTKSGVSLHEEATFILIRLCVVSAQKLFGAKISNRLLLNDT